MNLITKKFSRSLVSGIITFIYAQTLANLNQFIFLVFIDERIRTDINLTIVFCTSVLLNYYLHNKYVFHKKFETINLFKFYGINLSNIAVPLVFWNVYESVLPTPEVIEFNIWSIIIIISLFPIKFIFYKYIYKN
jgi:hypothetical protein